MSSYRLDAILHSDDEYSYEQEVYYDPDELMKLYGISSVSSTAVVNTSYDILVDVCDGHVGSSIPGDVVKCHGSVKTRTGYRPCKRNSIRGKLYCSGHNPDSLKCGYICSDGHACATVVSCSGMRCPRHQSSTTSTKQRQCKSGNSIASRTRSRRKANGSVAKSACRRDRTLTNNQDSEYEVIEMY